MSDLHLETLNVQQKNVWGILKEFSSDGTLGGGTSLMLQIKHRQSYDFDIFTAKLIAEKLLYKVRQNFSQIEILTDTGDELSFVSIPHQVKVSFIYYPYSPLYGLIRTDVLNLFSWQEIALDKAYAIGRRGVWRDYVDLFCLLQKSMTLKQIIAGAAKKFGNAFSEKLFLAQLVYFENLGEYVASFIDQNYSKQEIKEQLQSFVSK